MTTLEDYRKRFKGKGDGQNMPPDVQGRWDQVQAKMGQPGVRAPVGNRSRGWAAEEVAAPGTSAVRRGGTVRGGTPALALVPDLVLAAVLRTLVPRRPSAEVKGWATPRSSSSRRGATPRSSRWGPTSIYDVFQSAVPLMNANRDKQIGQSLAQAGSQGTRFGTAAENNVARIGADTALQQDQLLTNLLYQQGQSDADRQLQATGQAMNLAQIYDQMQRSRIDQLSQVGMWEQGRGDVLNQMPYQDWMQSRMGYLPQVLQALGSGNVSPIGQNPISTTTPAGEGIADYAMLAAMIYGMVSDARLKDNITRLGNGQALWTWKHSGELGAGVIAQDLEKYRPDLVIEAGGIKHVKYIGG